MYRPGDYVIPLDLPRPLLCRVAGTECARTSSGEYQILTLEPLQAPWRAPLRPDLVLRFDVDVRPAGTRALWQASVSAPDS
jgi:hypothetical protein